MLFLNVKGKFVENFSFSENVARTTVKAFCVYLVSEISFLSGEIQGL